MRYCTLDVSATRLRAELLPRLLGRTFHVTCGSRWPHIRESGSVRVNAGADLPSGFGSADRSLCRERGGVSVFDYRALTEDQLTLSLDACAPWGAANRCEDRLAILFLGLAAAAALDGPGLLRGVRTRGQMLVPFADACHPGPIAVADLEEVLEIRAVYDSEDPLLSALRSRHPARGTPEPGAGAPAT